MYNSYFIFGSLLSYILFSVSIYKIISKTDYDSYEYYDNILCFIPVLQYIVLLKILNEPLWYIIFLFIPILNLLFLIFILVDLCTGFDIPIWVVFISILFPLGIMILLLYLGFSDIQYIKE